MASPATPWPPSGTPPAGPRRHALAAAALGLPVIPLTRGKLPAVRSPHHADPAPVRCTGECGRVGHGIHDATTDPETVLALFAAAPWATGYGIACGRAPHHLIGLDLDVKNGTDSLASLRRLACEHGFTVPRTVTVLTPSGGRHLWLTGPPGRPVPNSAGRLAPGIDVRGSGGYLVGPGSYTTWGVYRLAPGPIRPAPVPGALLRLLVPPPHRAPPRHPDPYAAGHLGPCAPGPDATALIRFVRDSQPGQRNDRLFWAACRAYESGLGADLARDLTDAARSTGLTGREARATIASAARHTLRGRPEQGQQEQGRPEQGGGNSGRRAVRRPL
ncbi:bifunctional DNA primase/polymerase [Streptomyces sp. NPDC051776]|uniref:bifunctional DNA primase/polymerase n=1 Tax=Streptomyces sp. NPDC051776 TaxID=3155414 RepID=UPI00341700F6